MVTMAGQTYCGSCKVLALGGRQPQALSLMKHAPEAAKAMRLGYIGYLCFGIFLGPMAISEALVARRNIRASPHLLGWGKATAALWLGIGALVMWLLNIVSRVTGAA